jgi:hypothetical protein
MDNPTELVALFNNIISTTIPLTVAFVWLLVFFVRHKSLRTLFFWEKLLGKGIVFSDKCLQQAWENQKELQQLSAVLPAIKYKNIYHAKNMQGWKERNKIGDSELSGLDDFFIYNDDYSSIKLAKAKTPSRVAASLIFSCVAVITFILFLVSFKGAVFDAAIGELTINHETVWVYKDKVEGFSFNDKSWSVTLAEVNNNDKLTEDEIKSIRKSISSGDVKNFYEKNKMKTVATTTFFFALALYFSIILARFLKKSNRVSRLCDRVKHIKDQASNDSINVGDEVNENQERDVNNGEKYSN